LTRLADVVELLGAVQQQAAKLLSAKHHGASACSRRQVLAGWQLQVLVQECV
jgi:hypothetical protein